MIERIQYLDKDGKASDKDKAEVIIIKKYHDDGRMISHETFFKEDNEEQKISDKDQKRLDELEKKYLDEK